MRYVIYFLLYLFLCPSPVVHDLKAVELLPTLGLGSCLYGISCEYVTILFTIRSPMLRRYLLVPSKGWLCAVERILFLRVQPLPHVICRFVRLISERSVISFYHGFSVPKDVAHLFNYYYIKFNLFGII